MTELNGDQVVLRPVDPGDVPVLRQMLQTPEVRRWWRDEAEREGWPFDDPSEPRFAILIDGRVVGLVQYGEEDDPDYRHASIDIFLDPAVHGRGIGRETAVQGPPWVLGVAPSGIPVREHRWTRRLGGTAESSEQGPRTAPREQVQDR